MHLCILTNVLLLQRIKLTVQGFGSKVKLPVAIVLLLDSEINTTRLENALNEIETFCDYCIIRCKFDGSAVVHKVETALDFLARRVREPPALELNTLRLHVNEHLCSDLWRRMTSYAKWNDCYKVCLQSPNLVIDLYNDAVDRLCDIALEESRFENSKFPEEFEDFLQNPYPDVFPCDWRYFPTFWKSKQYNNLVKDSFEKLKLPKFGGTWPPKSESILENDILEYVTYIFENPHSAFYKVMSVILQNVNPIENFGDVATVLWSDVIEVVSSELIRDSDFSLRYTEFYTKSSFRDTFVVYNVDSLKQYSEATWFYVKNPAVLASIQQQCQNMICDEPEPECDEEVVEFSDFDISGLIEESSCGDEDEISKNRADIIELRNLMADLEETMEIQKKINASLQAHLKHAMES